MSDDDRKDGMIGRRKLARWIHGLDMIAINGDDADEKYDRVENLT